MKRCFKCKRTLELTEFYRHPMMGDGHLGKCRECTRRDVSENYRAKVERYRAYERDRFKDPKRRANALKYAKAARKLHPEKALAHRRVAYAVRTGKLRSQPCEVCGAKKTQAHHDDYSKPLDVRWLCFRHHREHHGQVVAP
jgi:hypothetical protein